MKKISLVLILAAVLFIFCGCGNFDVTCTIDKNNNVEMGIDISIQKKGLSYNEQESAESKLEELIVYWENSLGYDVSASYSDEDDYYIFLSKQVECESKKEAVYELMDLMSSSGSPFIKVEGGYTSSYLSDFYNVRAEIDLSNIVDYEYIDKLPPSEGNYILDGLANVTGTVEFDFDGNTIESDGNVVSNINTVELSLEKPAKIFSLMEIVNIQNQQEFDKLKNEITEDEKTRKQYLTFLLIAAGLLLALAPVVIILIIKSKTGKKDKKDKKDEEDKESKEDKASKEESKDE